MQRLPASPSFPVVMMSLVVMVFPMIIFRSRSSNVYGFVPEGFRALP